MLENEFYSRRPGSVAYEAGRRYGTCFRFFVVLRGRREARRGGVVVVMAVMMGEVVEVEAVASVGVVV